MKKYYKSKRPLMFYQYGDGRPHLNSGDRIRIVYPNGKIEWCSLDEAVSWSFLEDYFFKIKPCYIVDNNLKPKSIKEALKIINNYDIICGFSKQEFLGYL